jgi:hypothetical protein
MLEGHLSDIESQVGKQKQEYLDQYLKGLVEVNFLIANGELEFDRHKSLDFTKARMRLNKNKDEEAFHQMIEEQDVVNKPKLYSEKLYAITKSLDNYTNFVKKYASSDDEINVIFGEDRKYSLEYLSNNDPRFNFRNSRMASCDQACANRAGLVLERDISNCHYEYIGNMTFAGSIIEGWWHTWSYNRCFSNADFNFGMNYANCGCSEFQV